jgi:Deoxyribonuclease NucA/NucB
MADNSGLPPCEKVGRLMLPQAFADALLLGEDPDYKAFERSYILKRTSKITNGSVSIGDFEIMRAYPYMEQSLQTWRFRHNIYNDICQKQQDGLDVQPLSLAAPVTAAAANVTTKPQHSVADNIFRKRNAFVQIFDVGGEVTGPFVDSHRDGDVVNVLYNGNLILKNLLLTPWPGKTVTLTLQPSDLLPRKANVLQFQAVNTGSLLSFSASVGVDLIPGLAATVFQHKGNNNISVYPQAARHFISKNAYSTPMRLGLGLMCFDHRKWPQSTDHVRRAQAGLPDIRGRKNSVRIVTRDSLGLAADARTKARRAVSLLGYPSRGPLFDRDEYPPAMFIENGGKAHIQHMPKADNRASGGFLSKLMTPYKNTDQVELVDALIDSAAEGPLFCRDAF